MDMSQYLEIFIEESKEHLQNLNQNLLSLEKAPNEMTTLNEIFRVAHTLKGIAGTMGYTKIATLTHDMENVLQTIRNGEIKVTSNLVDVLFKCLDALENYVNEIINTGNEGEKEYNDIIKALNDINSKKEVKKEDTKKVKAKGPAKSEDQTESLSAVLIDSTLDSIPEETKAVEVKKEEKTGVKADTGASSYSVNIKLNQGCLLKSARAYIVFQTLEKISTIISCNPKIEDIEEEKFEYEFTVGIVTNEPKDTINKALTKIAEVEEVVISANDDLDETVEEEVNAAPEEDEEIQVAGDEGTSFGIKPMDMSTDKDKATVKPKTGKTVRVDIDRLDNLMNLVSELIIIKTTLEGATTSDKLTDYNETIEYLERITTSLHDAVMKVRMVPVENVFNRFPRMIRDLAKELGKEIVLNMSGEETEVDRTVIDELGDPLIHLLRNSADHGIEEPTKRRVLGKPNYGTINLRAYHDGNNVVIEVEDDGSGINFDKVRRKIVEKGIASRDNAAAMTDNDIVEYLFKPSFSTAEKVTDVSGRGVGLDVVKTKIEALGGAISVETEFEKGCKFIIRLPLTLAIIQALLVVLGKEKYAIPLSSIKEIINVTASEIKIVQNQEVYMLRNQVIPIVRLDKILDVARDDEGKDDLTIVIVKKGDKLSGFIIDSLIGQQEIVIKSLGKYLRGINSIAGATILGDGQVALIIDVNSLA